MADITINDQRSPFGNTRTKRVVEESMKRIGMYSTPFSGRVSKSKTNVLSQEIFEDTAQYHRSIPGKIGERWTQNQTYTNPVSKTFQLRIQKTVWSITDIVKDLALYTGPGEVERQMRDKRMAHNADRECLLLGSQVPLNLADYPTTAFIGSVMPTATTAGQFASYPCLSTTHVFPGLTGSAGGYNTTTKLHAAPSTGTVRDPTLELLDNMFDQMWKINASTSGYTVMMNLPIRKALDGLSGLFELQANQGAQSHGRPMVVNTIMGVQLTSGSMTFTLNRWMPTDAIYFIDFGNLNMPFIWNNDMKYPPKLGDSDEVVIRSQYGLTVKHETTQGILLDVKGRAVPGHTPRTA